MVASESHPSPSESDGTGKEVLREAIKVLAALSEKHGFGIKTEEYPLMGLTNYSYMLFIIPPFGSETPSDTFPSLLSRPSWRVDPWQEQRLH